MVYQAKTLHWTVKDATKKNMLNFLSFFILFCVCVCFVFILFNVSLTNALNSFMLILYNEKVQCRKCTGQQNVIYLSLSEFHLAWFSLVPDISKSFFTQSIKSKFSWPSQKKKDFKISRIVMLQFVSHTYKLSCKNLKEDRWR